MLQVVPNQQTAAQAIINQFLKQLKPQHQGRTNVAFNLMIDHSISHCSTTGPPSEHPSEPSDDTPHNDTVPQIVLSTDGLVTSEKQNGHLEKDESVVINGVNGTDTHDT